MHLTDGGGTNSEQVPVRPPMELITSWGSPLYTPPMVPLSRQGSDASSLNLDALVSNVHSDMPIDPTIGGSSRRPTSTVLHGKLVELTCPQGPGGHPNGVTDDSSPRGLVV